MERVRPVSRKDQVAGEILVVRVRLDQLVAVHRGQDHLPRNEPPRKPHVHMVRPQESASADAVLDESDRIVRKPPLTTQSRAPSDLSSDSANGCAQRPKGEQREPSVRCSVKLGGAHHSIT